MRAQSLKLGAIYINATTNEPMRLVTILPCEGVWMETYDSQGYGNLIQFEDVHYASLDEVQDFLNDLETYTNRLSVEMPFPSLPALPKADLLPLPKVNLPPLPKL
tara:strand:+ start:281 stop:595 length:315 start_codon:yes stop_codon:yes gene_type:complete